jgi:hypothetical protein
MVAMGEKKWRAPVGVGVSLNWMQRSLNHERQRSVVCGEERISRLQDKPDWKEEASGRDWRKPGAL